MNNISFFMGMTFLFIPLVASADKITVNINATVIERSCTISNDSLSKKVDVPAADLKYSRIGVPFAGKNFTISLEDCPENLTTASIVFRGDSDGSMANLLKNIDSTDAAARGVAFGLYDKEGKNINIVQNKTTLPVDASLGTNNYEFSAKYVKISGNYSPGKIVSVVDFELSYD